MSLSSTSAVLSFGGQTSHRKCCTGRTRSNAGSVRRGAMQGMTFGATHGLLITFRNFIEMSILVSAPASRPQRSDQPAPPRPAARKLFYSAVLPVHQPRKCPASAPTRPPLTQIPASHHQPHLPAPVRHLVLLNRIYTLVNEFFSVAAQQAHLAIATQPIQSTSTIIEEASP